MALLSTKRTQKTTTATEDSSDEASEASFTEGNAGWANSIKKVLQTTKPPTQNKIVLSRAKKIKRTHEKSPTKNKKTYDFEIEGNEVKQEDEAVEPDVKPEESALDAQLTRQQRKNVPLQLRVKPSFRDMERERGLRKVATRGTVQFFNAVRIQQKELKQQLEEAGPLDSRQDAVLNNIDKRKFLDVLMSGKRAKSAVIDNAVKKEEPDTDSGDEDDDEPGNGPGSKKKSEWNVLREDFMTNKKIKHWDEEDEQEDEGSDAAQNNSDDSGEE